MKLSKWDLSCTIETYSSPQVTNGNNNKGKILNQDRFEMAMNVRIKQEIKENSM